MNKKRFLILYLLAFRVISSAQVQVRLEPRHKNVFENKYLRLLDVHIAPGDTSIFHIHSTPSFFLRLTNSDVWTQVKGQDWTKSQRAAGEPSYDPYLNDSLIHRVTNSDTADFHVTDTEILSPYYNSHQIKPLPFEVLLDNEKILAYRVSNTSINHNIISKRGPMIAQLVEGDIILVHDEETKKIKEIKKGGYLYINPESSFHFSAPENEKINLVLLEIK
ncbi:MAG: hypothetical protein ACO25B_05250 [Chitinophagaceae bacterium]